MGRPRKPTEAHERNGTLREDRHGDRKLQPKFEGIPEPPKGISAEARAHWELVVPDLIKAGIAKAVDAPALAAMCEQWAEYCSAKRMKAYDWDDKRKRQMLVNAALRAWRDLAARFGLTPADRAKLEVAPDGEEKSAFEKYLEQAIDGKGAKN